MDLLMLLIPISVLALWVFMLGQRLIETRQWVIELRNAQRAETPVQRETKEMGRKEAK
jgi:hypothetical protein